ncbi:MAG: hypothetical protein WC865_10665 [Bacteroidales bacterium]
MGRFFRQDGGSAFGSFVLSELTILVDHTCIVYGYQGVLAFLPVEPDGREGRIGTFQDVRP